MSNTDILVANSRAAELCRTRKRRVKEVARLCRVIRSLDARLVGALVDCSPAARDAIRAEISEQDSALVNALIPDDVLFGLVAKGGAKQP